MSISQLKDLYNQNHLDLDQLFVTYSLNRSAVYNKNAINSIGVTGLRFSVFGPQALINFIVDTAKSANCNRQKLALLMENLADSLLSKIVYHLSSLVIDQLENSIEILNLVITMKREKVCSLDQLINQFWMPSLNVIATNFDAHEWYFFGLEDFFGDTEIPYARYQTLANCLIDGLNALNCNRFGAPVPDMRALFQLRLTKAFLLPNSSFVKRNISDFV